MASAAERGSHHVRRPSLTGLAPLVTPLVAPRHPRRRHVSLARDEGVQPHLRQVRPSPPPPSSRFPQVSPRAPFAPLTTSTSLARHQVSPRRAPSGSSPSARVPRPHRAHRRVHARSSPGASGRTPRAAGILANEMVAQTLKRIFAHPRPPSCARVIRHPASPSSHARSSRRSRRRSRPRGAAGGAFPLPSARRRRGEERGGPRRRPPPPGSGAGKGTSCGRGGAVAASWIVAVAVAESGVYLGCHSLDQVLAGSAVGLIVGAAWARACAWASDAFAPSGRAAAPAPRARGQGRTARRFRGGGAKSLAGDPRPDCARFARARRCGTRPRSRTPWRWSDAGGSRGDRGDEDDERQGRYVLVSSYGSGRVWRRQ